MYQIQYEPRANLAMPFSKINSTIHYVPNKSEMLMCVAVREALLSGLFYTTDVYAFIVEKLKNELTDISLKKGKDHVVNGYIGMDIYYCRKNVEIIMTKSANIEALNKLVESGKVKIGTKFKKMRYSGTNFSTTTVTSLSMGGGMLKFEGVRRGSSSRYEFSIGANDTRILSQLCSSVDDKDFVESDCSNDLTMITINFGENSRAELQCRI